MQPNWSNSKNWKSYRKRINIVIERIVVATHGDWMIEKRLEIWLLWERDSETLNIGMEGFCLRYCLFRGKLKNQNHDN